MDDFSSLNVLTKYHTDLSFFSRKVITNDNYRPLSLFFLYLIKSFQTKLIEYFHSNSKSILYIEKKNSLTYIRFCTVSFLVSLPLSFFFFVYICMK